MRAFCLVTVRYGVTAKITFLITWTGISSFANTCAHFDTHHHSLTLLFTHSLSLFFFFNSSSKQSVNNICINYVYGTIKTVPKQFYFQ